MTKITQTFLQGPATCSLKKCHIPTVGWLQYNCVCVCVLSECLYNYIIMRQALHGNKLLMSLYAFLFFSLPPLVVEIAKPKTLSQNINTENIVN